MLGWRLFLSAIMIPAFIGGFYFDAQFGPAAPFLCVLAVLLAARSSWELVDLLKTRSFEPQVPIVMAGTMIVVVANWIPRWLAASSEDAPSGIGALGACLVAFALVVLALFLNAALRYREPGNSMESLGAEVLTVTYVGILLSFTAQLRWVAGADAGYLALGSLIIATKSGDIGAYTLGRLFGKRKLIPRLSPGKTWAGAYGALLGAGAASWAWFTFATPLLIPGSQPCPPQWAILFGVVIGLVGLIGDLCESLIKRDVGQKDSAALLPGFGGVLDILDSIFYAGPIAYILWLTLPLGPT